MALYRRGQIWYVSFSADGKRVQESTGTANKREAEKFRARRMAEAERGEYFKAARVLFSDFGSLYLEYAKVHKRSWIRDEQIMAHLNAAFGPMALPDIGAFAIEHYKIGRVKVVSPATVNREIALLKHLFNLAEHWGLYRGRNPMKGIRFLPEDNLRFRSVTEAEEAVLLSHCSPYLQDMVVFAINTGLRLGDILDLKWEEVDIDANLIRKLIRKNRRILEVPLNEAAAHVVRGWHGIRKCEFVFYNPETGGPWKDLWLGLKKACRRAGLNDVTWHTFRHTFASRLNGAGVDLVTVKELLGHSSVSVTMRYAHTNREGKARAVALLGGNCFKNATGPATERKSA